jgi:hypothetical protein
MQHHRKRLRHYTITGRVDALSATGNHGHQNRQTNKRNTLREQGRKNTKKFNKNSILAWGNARACSIEWLHAR